MRSVLLASVALSLALLAPLRAGAQSTLEAGLGAANEAYFRGDYDTAIAGYQRLVELGVRDADVFYNLGTAYARAGRYGLAIAAFERALRVEPGDVEAASALDRSRSILARRRADREGEATVESGPPLGEAVFAGISESTLAIAVLLLELFFFAALAAFPLVRREHVRLALGVVAPLLGIFLAIAGIGLAIRSGMLDEGDPAVVVRDRAVLREGPRCDAQERARGREGERASIVRRDGEWVEVRIGARRGWAHAEDVVAIDGGG
jgi:tetratricopeptide (TPR) repeat protein